MQDCSLEQKTFPQFDIRYHYLRECRAELAGMKSVCLCDLACLGPLLLVIDLDQDAHDAIRSSKGDNQAVGVHLVLVEMDKVRHVRGFPQTLGHDFVQEETIDAKCWSKKSMSIHQ